MHNFILTFLLFHIWVKLAKKSQLSGISSAFVTILIILVINLLPGQKLSQNVTIVEVWIWADLRCLFLFSLYSFAPIFITRYVLRSCRYKKASFQGFFDFITVELCSYCIISLLYWLIMEVIYFEELKCILITTINQNSELLVVELIRVWNRLDTGDLNRVVF